MKKTLVILASAFGIGCSVLVSTRTVNIGNTAEQSTATNHQTTSRLDAGSLDSDMPTSIDAKLNQKESQLTNNMTQ